MTNLELRNELKRLNLEATIPIDLGIFLEKLICEIERLDNR